MINSLFRKNVQFFLKFSNFYWRFIKKYSEIVHALTELIKKTVPFYWNENAALSFQTLKTVFLKALLLTQFNLKKSIFIETNISNYAVSDILSQQSTDTHWHLVTFFSCKLQSAECNYDTLDQELLIIVTSFQTWRHYLKEAKHTIKVLTDHYNLHYFLDFKLLIWWQTHWAEFLSEFNFSIKYQTDFKNSADALSWWADYQLTESDDYMLVSFFKLITLSLYLTEVRKTESLNEDVLLSHIIVNDICHNLKMHDFKKAEEISHNMRWKKRLLYLGDQLYISDDDILQLWILRAFHDSSIADYLKRNNTLTFINDFIDQRWLYW